MTNNTLVVGKDEELLAKGLIARELNWISGSAPRACELTVMIRYRHEGVEAVIENIENNKLRVVFKKQQRSVTPGQAVVFYDGDVVLGGGWIEEAIK
jgi:tRNA-specific 2-thiouridylase